VTSSSAPAGAATVTRTGSHGAGGAGQPEPGLPVARARFTADGRRLELLLVVNTGQPGAAALAARAGPPQPAACRLSESEHGHRDARAGGPGTVTVTPGGACPQARNPPPFSIVVVYAVTGRLPA
jgi:hypothetical protein